MSNCERFEIMLPTQFNDGERISGHVVDSWLYGLAEHFGGATVEHVRGIWTDSGRVYDEPMQRVTLLLMNPTPETSWKARGVVIAIARQVQEEGKQESVLCTHEGEAFFLEARGR